MLFMSYFIFLQPLSNNNLPSIKVINRLANNHFNNVSLMILL